MDFYFNQSSNKWEKKVKKEVDLATMMDYLIRGFGSMNEQYAKVNVRLDEMCKANERVELKLDALGNTCAELAVKLQEIQDVQQAKDGNYEGEEMKNENEEESEGNNDMSD